MKTKPSDAGIAAVRLLEALNASADFNPVLKSVAGGALHFAKLVEDYHSNKKAWAAFAEHVQKNVALIAQAIADQLVDSTSIQEDLSVLNKVLIRMSIDIEQKQPSSTFKRALAFVKDPKKIEDMQKDFDRALQLFHLGAEIHTSRDIAEILQEIHKSSLGLNTVVHGLSQLDTGLQRSRHAATLDRLPYAKGATWNLDQMCHPGTRGIILNEIMDWFADFKAHSSSQIFCLTGAPGAGKTAISHSVSKMCTDKGWLTTAFFFNKEDSTRVSMLFGTVICDLSARSSSFRNLVTQAIEQDPSLTSAGPSRQFKSLIAQFAHKLPEDVPIVIVLDALDEGLDGEIINLLIHGIQILPCAIQWFITTRDIEDIKLLLQASHVHHRSFIHHRGRELEDVKYIAQSHLLYIGLIKNLEGWPMEELVDKVVERSQGLMIWVVAVCQYLKEVLDPDGDLKDLLERKLPDDQGAEDNMDELYAMVLLKFPWKDRKFVKGYQQVMGTLLASKIPLSAHAIEALHCGINQFPNVLQIMKPLLLPSDKGQPIQILHQSLHDLLIGRAQLKDIWRPFAVNESTQHQHLAVLCLQTINRNLSNEIPGIGYIYKKWGVPALPESAIPEHVTYACTFWMDHLVIGNNPSQEVIDAVQELLEHKFSVWLEVSASTGKIKDMSPLLDWITKECPQLLQNIYSLRVAEALRRITYNLLFENRRNEALITAELGVSLLPRSLGEGIVDHNPRDYARALDTLATAQSVMQRKHSALDSSRESVRISRKLVEQDQISHHPDLALFLNNHSNLLSEMGLRNEALQASRESLRLYQTLADQNPSEFQSYLAMAMHNLANRLSDMHPKNEFSQEALQISKSAMELYKELANQNPAELSPDLARALHSLAQRLSDSQLHEEALQTSTEALCMYKELADQNPFAFSSDLAHSMCAHSFHLEDMGLKEEALQTNKESLRLYKKLGTQNPAAFAPDIARSLYNLALRLFEMGMKEDALHASQEAIDLRRELALGDPGAFSAVLADSLHNHSLYLSKLGVQDKAIEFMKETTEVWRELTIRHPNDSVYEGRLHDTLNKLENLLPSKDSKEDV